MDLGRTTAKDPEELRWRAEEVAELADGQGKREDGLRLGVR